VLAEVGGMRCLAEEQSLVVLAQVGRHRLSVGRKSAEERHFLLFLPSESPRVKGGLSCLLGQVVICLRQGEGEGERFG
jgi:hypothetical protein